MNYETELKVEYIEQIFLKRWERKVNLAQSGFFGGGKIEDESKKNTLFKAATLKLSIRQL